MDFTVNCKWNPASKNCPSEKLPGSFFSEYYQENLTVTLAVHVYLPH